MKQASADRAPTAFVALGVACHAYASRAPAILCRSGGSGTGGAARRSAPRRPASRSGDLRDLRAAADEGLAQARAAASQPSAVAAAQELEERKATKKAAMAAAENAMAGRCSNCSGTGVEWSCENCSTEGFLLDEADAIWRTCEKCLGRGRMPCQVCSPDPDEMIYSPSET